MVLKYVSVILKLCSLGLMVSAGSFWAGARVSSRPKYKDEQTLIGGTIWSQIIIPMGLMISRSMGENLDTFVHGYFLVAGVILLFSTGFFLVIRECVVATKHRRAIIENRIRENNKIPSQDLKCDKIYFCIGIFTLLAGTLTLVDLIIVVTDS